VFSRRDSSSPEKPPYDFLPQQTPPFRERE
jgi:hypothetical protein